MIGRMTDRFLRFGDRLFTHDSWHHVAYQPVLFLVLWGAALRVAFFTGNVPIPFKDVLSPWADHVWIVLSLACPPLALLSWWLIVHAKPAKAALIGLWLRLSADIGQFTALLTYHIATSPFPWLFTAITSTEAMLYSRYVTAATLLFIALLIVRDVWTLLATERIATRL